jgi:hypothetical protein
MNKDTNAPAGSDEATPGSSGARLESIAGDWAEGVRPVSISPRRGRLRWGIAIAIVACVAIVTGLGAFVLSGAGGTRSLTAGYAPKDTIVFLTVRTDLPGDQREKLVQLLAHFPGFKDRAQFDTGYDTLLNRLTGFVSQDLEYTSAFKPWTEGELSIAVTRVALPSTIDVAGILSLAGPKGTLPGTVEMVGIAALKDRAKAEDWIKSQTASEAYLPQDYAGTVVHIKPFGSTPTAYAVTEKVLLFGTPAAVKASLDTATIGSLEAEAGYRTAMASFSGDRIASFYVATRPLANALYGDVSGVGGLSREELDFALASMPGWLAGSLRVESDRFVVDMAAPGTGRSAGSSRHPSRLAAELPASTVALVEAHSVGQLVRQALAAYGGAEAPASYRSLVQTVQAGIKAIGGVDWLGDAALAVTGDGTTFSGGLVAEAGDSETAAAEVGLLTNALVLTSNTTGIVTRQETYKGTTITLVHVPANTLYGNPALDAALAAKGSLIVVGWDEDFVKAVLDTTPGSSLARVGDYRAAMHDAGEYNTMSVFVNLGVLVDQVGPSMLSADRSYYDLYIKPYLSHLGGVALVQTDDQPIISKLVVMAK